MEYALPRNESDYLRELAKKQSEYAHLPVMREREHQWFALNFGTADTPPPIVVDTPSFDRDFLPEKILSCTSPFGRELERDLLRCIRTHELIGDDRVIPDCFFVDWITDVDLYGVPISRTDIPDSQGVPLGHKLHHPIKHLAEDIEKLSPISCSVDRESTERKASFVTELFAGILEVEMQMAFSNVNMLTHKAFDLMGLETFFLAMCDSPDLVHRLMDYLVRNALEFYSFHEREGLLKLNSRNHASFFSSYNFTDLLPGEGFDGEHVRVKDMWLASNSQETVSISPSMFGEFCFPYYVQVCEQAGLVYYGCCEPVHPIYEKYISKIPGLRKVSISRWCNEEYMGEALRGGEVVYSRKPNPNILGVGGSFDEEAWRKEINSTLVAARGAPLEFIIRDVYTVGDIGFVRRAVEIARQEIDKFY